MNKSLLLSLALLMGSYATLSSAPLGAPPQFNTTKTKSETLQDGKSIIIGKYNNRQDADFQLSSLLDFMDTNSKIVNLELRHGFDYAVKEKKGLYTVSVEPFIDDDVLNEVLTAVKSRFPKAVAGVCLDCVREEMLRKAQADDQEFIENAIALDDETNTHISVTVEEDDVVDTPEEGSIKEEAPFDLSFELPFDIKYIYYGVGGLALLILIMLIMRKPKKSSDKEMRAMYAQAKALEQEMDGGAEKEEVVAVEKATAKVEEPVAPPVREKPVAKPAPVAPKAAVAPKEVVKERAPEPEVVPQPAVQPAQSSELKHKLREPNPDVANISKDSFKEFEGMRLLIAEDNLINQKVIVGLLKDSGINIKIANDGQECLDILAEDPNYPIILMDAHMPRIDGLEATRQIRANPAYSHITVMALSGDTGADDVRKMRESGMEEQLEKPLKIAALYQALYCYFDPSAIDGAAEELPEIHLDNSLGLEMLGGDIELYHEILSEFQSLYHDSDDKIELWLKHDDLNSAKALLLDVKGIGESIGTAELTQTSEEFREAIIAEDKASFPQLIKRYRSQLQSILADIAEV